jgi:hypothetical protein
MAGAVCWAEMYPGRKNPSKLDTTVQTTSFIENVIALYLPVIRMIAVGKESPSDFDLHHDLSFAKMIAGSESIAYKHS